MTREPILSPFFLPCNPPPWGTLAAVSLETGEPLWERPLGTLPAGGNATPMTYRLAADRRQFVVIAAGGHGKLGTRRGDFVVVYALPEPR